MYEHQQGRIGLAAAEHIVLLARVGAIGMAAVGMVCIGQAAALLKVSQYRCFVIDGAAVVV